MNRIKEPKTFILGGMKRERPILFTPVEYDARPGLLHGFGNGDRPISISVGRSLTPYEPVELEWDDE